MVGMFTRFDAADYLKTDEDVAAYLQAAAEEGDPEVMVAAIAAVARARNMSQLARDAGITREGLYKALAPASNPGFGTVTKVARALGYGFNFVPIQHAVVGGAGPSRGPGGGYTVAQAGKATSAKSKKRANNEESPATAKSLRLRGKGAEKKS